MSAPSSGGGVKEAIDRVSVKANTVLQKLGTHSVGKKSVNALDKVNISLVAELDCNTMLVPPGTMQ